MSDYMFISYSRDDGDYAQRLAERLMQDGFDVWLDDRLEDEERWLKIVDALEECAAFISIVSDAANESEWVQNEIMVATDMGTPAFAVFLEDDELVDDDGVSVFDSDTPFFFEIAEVVPQKEGQQGRNVANGVL
jgi:hypothetical protein